MRVVEEDTKTGGAVPFWKIDYFLGFPGCLCVRVDLRPPRSKIAKTERSCPQKRTFWKSAMVGGLPFGGASRFGFLARVSGSGARPDPVARPLLALEEATVLRRASLGSTRAVGVG